MFLKKYFRKIKIILLFCHTDECECKFTLCQCLIFQIGKSTDANYMQYHGKFL